MRGSPRRHVVVALDIDETCCIGQDTDCALLALDLPKLVQNASHAQLREVFAPLVNPQLVAAVHALRGRAVDYVFYTAKGVLARGLVRSSSMEPIDEPHGSTLAFEAGQPDDVMYLERQLVVPASPEHIADGLQRLSLTTWALSRLFLGLARPAPVFVTTHANKDPALVAQHMRLDTRTTRVFLFDDVAEVLHARLPPPPPGESLASYTGILPVAPFAFANLDAREAEHMQAIWEHLPVEPGVWVDTRILDPVTHHWRIPAYAAEQRRAAEARGIHVEAERAQPWPLHLLLQWLAGAEQAFRK